MAHKKRPNSKRRQRARAEHNQRRAKRRKRRSSARADVPVMPMSADGRYAVEVRADAETHIRYVEAHRHLPPGFPWPGCDVEGTLQYALHTLVDRTASEASILEAIMLLAHIPDPRALGALRAYGESRYVHADMARLGEAECAMWLAERMGTPGEVASLLN